MTKLKHRKPRAPPSNKKQFKVGKKFLRYDINKLTAALNQAGPLVTPEQRDNFKKAHSSNVTKLNSLVGLGERIDEEQGGVAPGKDPKWFRLDPENWDIHMYLGNNHDIFH